MKTVMAAAAAFLTMSAWAGTNDAEYVETEVDLLVTGRLTTYNSSVTNVRAGAFTECRALEACNLEYAQSVGVGAFRGCVGLETIYLGALTNLAGWASMLVGCPRLMHVHLPLVGVDAAKAAGLPFGTTARAVVFHLADGEYDRNGRKID